VHPIAQENGVRGWWLVATSRGARFYNSLHLYARVERGSHHAREGSPFDNRRFVTVVRRGPACPSGEQNAKIVHVGTGFSLSPSCS